MSCALLAQQPGEVLPPCVRGEFDLHQIHTGRGNALLIVTPRGETILVDAGDVPDGRPLEVGPRRPDASRPAGAWVAHYIRRLGYERLDTLVVSHYHDDHLGGVKDLLANLPVTRLMDRGDHPPPPAFPVVGRYLVERAKHKAYRPIRAGEALITAEDFEIRTVAANGHVWTGRDASAASAFPPDWQELPAELHPNENHFSVSFRIRYGAFRYFAGADLIGVVLDGLPEWHDLETPVAKVTGPVDVAVLNHHGWLDTTNEFFLRTLTPRVAILPAWHVSHPDHGVLRRLKSPRGPRPDLFTTTLLGAPAAIFRYLGQPFRNTEGHIVVRVAPGGKEYRVFVLDATREDGRILSVHGPYAAKAAR
jgi:beta-lactamase superfamily II metal-dependent hydrolase